VPTAKKVARACAAIELPSARRQPPITIRNSNGKSSTNQVARDSRAEVLPDLGKANELRVSYDVWIVYLFVAAHGVPTDLRANHIPGMSSIAPTFPTLAVVSIEPAFSKVSVSGKVSPSLSCCLMRNIR
jgi:hypothetical protein